MPWHRFRQVKLQWISSVEKFKSLLPLRSDIISKSTPNKFKNKWLHGTSKFPHNNDSTVGQNCFFLILFLLNVQYKPAFLSSLYLPSIFMPFPLFSKFSNTQLQKHSQNFYTHTYYYYLKSAEPVTRLKYMKEQNKVLFMSSKHKYYLFLLSKKSQCIFHRICTAASETSPLHKRFNMILHRISSPPVVQQGQATGSIRPHGNRASGSRAYLTCYKGVMKTYWGNKSWHQLSLAFKHGTIVRALTI